MTTTDSPVPAVRAQTPIVSLLLVALGAGVGSLLRWWLGSAVGETGFPWATMAINISGCFLLAAMPAVSALRRWPSLLVLLGPGLLGGFTTVSTWALESRELAADGNTAAAGSYVAATLLACLGAAAAGRLVVRLAPGPVR